MNFKRRLKKIKEAVTPEPEFILHPDQTPGYTPMVTQIPDDYKVEKVTDYGGEDEIIGFHYEPALSSITDATGLDELRWLAAVVNCNHPELRVSVREAEAYTNDVRQSGQYSVSFYRSGLSSMDYSQTWTMLNGLDMGADAIKSYYEIEKGHGKFS